MPPSKHARAVSSAGASPALGLSLVLLTGCLVAPPEGGGEVEEAVTAETVGASLCIQVSDASSPETSLADVQALKVRIKEDTDQTVPPVHVDLNVDLLKAPAPDTVWCSSPLPALPLGKTFNFFVSAYSSKALQPAHLLFSGTATQTLTVHDSRILVTLTPRLENGEASGQDPGRLDGAG